MALLYYTILFLKFMIFKNIYFFLLLFFNYPNSFVVQLSLLKCIGKCTSSFSLCNALFYQYYLFLTRQEYLEFYELFKYLFWSEIFMKSIFILFVLVQMYIKINYYICLQNGRNKMPICQSIPKLLITKNGGSNYFTLRLIQIDFNTLTTCCY